MVLSLDAARICLDCDIITDGETCPTCDRDQTFPLAVWLVPLQASRRSRRTARRPWPTPEPAAAPERPADRDAAPARWLVVVRAGETELYEYLRERFEGGGDVEVVLDRRRESPRRGVAAGGRPRGRRRRPLSAGEREWWELAGFRVVCRAESFRLYELFARASGRSPAGE